ncbi:MAG TPA: 2-phospho-L-lactate guanylyltransferase [Solirubrobacteraceae bacterium]|jgi:2-phospho-L-lactate guanylyltransferase|nr:2-phospho-L-lactate guanylyltransferase [Solirubrobacteraceae bacterium]
MRTAAILPVKRFSLAKQRLGESVTEQLRLDLARAMVGDVLVALSQCAAIELTIVVTNEPSVTAAANYTGAIVVADAAESGQSAAVSIGVERALAEGAERALCIPGDCPALDPDELEVLLQGAPDAIVLIPDRHGTGTNGLLLTPPDVMTPSFGPDSRERHGELAASANVNWRTEQVSSLQLDIDTGADLAVLRERLAGNHGQAPRTRSVLGMVERHWRSSQPAA